MANIGICSVESCGKASSNKERGFCRNHDYKFLRYGDAIAGKVLAPRGAGLSLLQSLTENEQKECVYWPYHRRGGVSDYGGVYFRGKMHIASRVACILLNGEPPSEEHQAAHSCGNGRQGCVNPYHVYWATPVENMSDMIRHGTRRKGQQMATCKLTPDQVISIRKESSMGSSQLALCEKYKISRWNLRHIIDGITWKHLL